jgi:hypothetical protein
MLQPLHDSFKAVLVLLQTLLVCQLISAVSRHPANVTAGYRRTACVVLAGDWFAAHAASQVGGHFDCSIKNAKHHSFALSSVVHATSCVNHAPSQICTQNLPSPIIAILTASR